MEKDIDRIWNPFFCRVFATNALMYLGLQMVQSLVGKYASTLGAASAVVGLVSSMFAITCLLFKLFAGPSIDAFNRKNVLMTALLIIAIAFIGMGLTHTIPMIMVFRLLQGVGQAFTATCCLALASDALPKDKFASGIGIFTLAQAVCQAIGPSVGLAIAERFSYNVTFLVAGFCMTGAAISASRIHTSFTQGKRFRLNYRNIIAAEALLPTFMLFLLSATYHTIQSFLVIYAEDVRGVDGIGGFFIVYAAALLVTRPLFGRFMDKLGFVAAMVPALICFALSFILIGIADNLTMFLVAALVSAFGYGVAAPAIHTLCMQSVSKDRRGAASSTSYIGSDVGNLVGPVSAGFIAQAVGYSKMWCVMTIPIFATLALVLVKAGTLSKIEKRFKVSA